MESAPVTRALALAAAALVLPLLAPSAAADAAHVLDDVQHGRLPVALPPLPVPWDDLPRPEVEFDLSDYAQYQWVCVRGPCLPIELQACSGVLYLGANTNLLPDYTPYAEVSYGQDGPGAYGGYSSHCGDRPTFSIGPGDPVVGPGT